MKLTVTNVDKIPQASGMMWRVTYSVARDAGDEEFDNRINPAHTTFIHAFPELRIMAAIAEYGLNPDDMDAVMDVVLAEPFLDPNDGEPGLFSGETVDVIREAHLRRCARAKLKTKMSTRGIRNPVEMVRNVRIDPQEMASVRTTVNENVQGYLKRGQNRG
jgi:hypothetical protein